jgi:RimJ/RimL family protein N-acetyltransferase
LPAPKQKPIYETSEMRHTLHTEGLGMRLRPVQMNDAAFIVWLRNQDYVKGRVGDSASDVAGQQQWLEAYFRREDDFYFLAETMEGTPLGTNGLYNRSDKSAEWGRYIIRPEVQAALPSAMLIFDLAFERLGLHELRARCVSTNVTMHSLIRKYGFRQTVTKFANQTIGGRPVDMIHFVLKAGDWPRCRQRLLPLAEFVETRINKWEKHTHEAEIAGDVGR